MTEFVVNESPPLPFIRRFPEGTREYDSESWLTVAGYARLHLITEEDVLDAGASLVVVVGVRYKLFNVGENLRVYLG